MSAIGDNPITRPDQDLLRRASLAESFTRQILDSDASDGLVVGVLGPWGSGKTSFLNLVHENLKTEQIDVLKFNPWMFSGTEHLIQSFFAELSTQLRLASDLSDIGEDLETYGALLTFVPFVGPWVARGAVISRAARRIRKRHQRGAGLEAARNKLRATLQDRHSPIVIILDDLDRLSNSEIRDMLRLLRLTAQFPNVIYLVAFDWHRVEQVLGEDGYGQAYLAKIVQIPLDLPIIHRPVLQEQLSDALGSAIGGVPSVDAPDEQLFAPVLKQVIIPLLENIRDVRRYAASIRTTVENVAGQIEIVDVLTLEAFRVLRPDVFARLTDSIEALTTTDDMFFSLDDSKESRLAGQIQQLLEEGQNSRDEVYNLINHLFPAASRHLDGPTLGSGHAERWLRERRVAHRDILGLYFERVAGAEIRSVTNAEQALCLMSDSSKFDNWLRSLETESLERCIASLRLFRRDFVSSHVIPASTVLLSILEYFPDDEEDWVDRQPQAHIEGIVLDLLGVLESEDAVEAAATSIISELQTCSTHLGFIELIGYRERIGYRLVSIEAAERFEEELRHRIRNLSIEELIKERELFSLLVFTAESSGDSKPTMIVPETPMVTCALLEDMRRRMYERKFGYRAILMGEAPNWDALAAICGGRDAFCRRIDAIRSLASAELFGMLELADDWLSSRE